VGKKGNRLRWGKKPLGLIGHKIEMRGQNRLQTAVTRVIMGMNVNTNVVNGDDSYYTAFLYQNDNCQVSKKYQTTQRFG
jgi:hypothetical protein